MAKVVKGLPAEWEKCSRTVALNKVPRSIQQRASSNNAFTLSYHNHSIAVGAGSNNIIVVRVKQPLDLLIFRG